MHTFFNCIATFALAGIAWAVVLGFQIHWPRFVMMYRLRADIRNTIHEVAWALLALTVVFFSVTAALWLSNCTDNDLQREGAANVQIQSR